MEHNKNLKENSKNNTLLTNTNNESNNNNLNEHDISNPNSLKDNIKTKPEKATHKRRKIEKATHKKNKVKRTTTERLGNLTFVFSLLIIIAALIPLSSFIFAILFYIVITFAILFSFFILLADQKFMQIFNNGENIISSVSNLINYAPFALGASTFLAVISLLFYTIPKHNTRKTSGIVKFIILIILNIVGLGLLLIQPIFSN